MSDKVEFEPKLLHPDRKLITPMDKLRGADFSVGTVVSGATVSGGTLALYTVSSPVKVRILNLEIWNAEPGWLEIEFRDGGFGGGRVLGPYNLLPRAGLSKNENELAGRYFTSAVCVVVLSGYAAQPLSNGVKINIGRLNEPSDWFE